MQLLEKKTSRWNLNVLFSVVYRMSAVRNPIKEPTDITGGYNVEMVVTFDFFYLQYDCQTRPTWIPRRLESRSGDGAA